VADPTQGMAKASWTLGILFTLCIKCSIPHSQLCATVMLKVLVWGLVSQEIDFSHV
jgi:hypothetical protein